MPSDDRSEPALAALAAPLDVFRSALASAVEEVRAYLATHHDAEGGAATDGADLGVFAAGRIDFARFSALASDEPPVDPQRLGRMQRAFAALSGLAKRGSTPYRVVVPPGGDLRDTVTAALRDVGRAFGAARAADLLRNDRFVEAEHEALFEPLPFARWTDAERRLAPPLFVEVDGDDLRAGVLAEYLDGALKLVLCVRGESTPAPLVRLVTPGTFVLQAAAPDALGPLAAWEGPGVAALVGNGAALFVHDPNAGEEPWERPSVGRLPEDVPTSRCGGASVAQQREELRQLAALATAPVVPEPVVAAEPAPADAAAAATPAPADPVDKLAAWLLSQADLTGVA